MQNVKLNGFMAFSLLTGCVTKQVALNNFNEVTIFKNTNNSEKTLSIEAVN